MAGEAREDEARHGRREPQRERRAGTEPSEVASVETPAGARRMPGEPPTTDPASYRPPTGEQEASEAAGGPPGGTPATGGALEESEARPARGAMAPSEPRPTNGSLTPRCTQPAGTAGRMALGERLPWDPPVRRAAAERTSWGSRARPGAKRTGPSSIQLGYHPGQGLAGHGDTYTHEALPRRGPRETGGAHP